VDVLTPSIRSSVSAESASERWHTAENSPVLRKLPGNNYRIGLVRDTTRRKAMSQQ
jgi:hypothetical protein